jgi:hypothetical protein
MYTINRHSISSAKTLQNFDFKSVISISVSKPTKKTEIKNTQILNKTKKSEIQLLPIIRNI